LFPRPTKITILTPGYYFATICGSSSFAKTCLKELERNSAKKVSIVFLELLERVSC